MLINMKRYLSKLQLLHIGRRITCLHIYFILLVEETNMRNASRHGSVQRQTPGTESQTGHTLRSLALQPLLCTALHALLRLEWGTMQTPLFLLQKGSCSNAKLRPQWLRMDLEQILLNSCHSCTYCMLH